MAFYQYTYVLCYTVEYFQLIYVSGEVIKILIINNLYDPHIFYTCKNHLANKQQSKVPI